MPILVTEVLLIDKPVTRIWFSESAYKSFEKFEKKENPRSKFIKLLRRYSRQGFRAYEGGVGFPIKHEWDQVYRVGNGALFRLIGFYFNGSETNFIVIDAFKKGGQQLNAVGRKRIDAVKRIMQEGEWNWNEKESIDRPD